MAKEEIPMEELKPILEHGGWAVPPDAKGNGLWVKREVSCAAPPDKSPTIYGKIERELTIHTSAELPDVVRINGVEYRPKKG